MPGLIEWIKKHRPARTADLAVLSFPKSGRTWHRVMLGYYVATTLGQPVEQALELLEPARGSAGSRVRYSHNGANFNDNVHHSDDSVANPGPWRGKDVLLIVRDPRDVLVSAYHHARFRSRIFDGEISEFIRQPTTGIDKVLTALNRWHNSRNLARTFNITSYEAMHREPGKVLELTLNCLNMAVDEQIVADAVDFAKFDKMKTYEASDFFVSGIMRNKTGSAMAAKVREGKVGSFTDHLSEADIAFIRQRTSDLGDPFSSYYGAQA